MVACAGMIVVLTFGTLVLIAMGDAVLGSPRPDAAGRAWRDVAERAERAQRFLARIVPRQVAAPQWHGKRRLAAGVCRSSSTYA